MFDDHEEDRGLSLRDRFALVALRGLLAADPSAADQPGELAEKSFEIAFAMQKISERPPRCPTDEELANWR